MAAAKKEVVEEEVVEEEVVEEEVVEEEVVDEVVEEEVAKEEVAKEEVAEEKKKKKKSKFHTLLETANNTLSEKEVTNIVEDVEIAYRRAQEDRELAVSRMVNDVVDLTNSTNKQVLDFVKTGKFEVATFVASDVSALLELEKAIASVVLTKNRIDFLFSTEDNK